MPRPYQDEHDMKKMMALLVAGRKSANGTYYVHVGDLSWWLFYLAEDQDWREFIYLWEGQRPAGELDGWALFSPTWRTFDVFVQPEGRGSRYAAEMYLWAEDHIAEMVKEHGGEEIRTMWVFADDLVLTAHLEQRGFRRAGDHMLYMQRSLSDPTLEVPLPAGFQMRPVGGEHEAQLRAAASYAAFESKMPFEAYWQRYLRFMRSEVYDPSLDLVAVAPDGRMAAFCIVWLDEINQVGLFEPVGTHPDFRQQGLGKALILEGLRRMKTHGMATAIVGAESDNPAGQRLYQAAGFRPVNQICTYVKNLG